MNYNMQLSMVSQNDEIEGFYLLKSASLRTTSAGKNYLNAQIADVSGVLDIKVWDYSGPIDTQCEGQIVKVRGVVLDYKGTPQLNVSKIRMATENDTYDASLIVPTAPIDSMKEFEYVQNLITTIEDDDYRRICEMMLDRHVVTFGRMPAGKSVHHSFLCGLLMHTGSMLRIADFLSTEIYPYAVDRSLLLAGTLLHDFAKEKEYAMSDLGLITDITLEGALEGHLVMGAEEVGEVGRSLDVPDEKILLLKHMILSHHGMPEHGAAVVPCIAEAELLSYIDLLDSRMEIYAETFETLEHGKFSDRIWALDNKKIYNHN